MGIRETQPPEPTLCDEKPLSLLPARSGAHPFLRPKTSGSQTSKHSGEHLEALVGERGVGGRENRSCFPASPTPDCFQRISVREASGNTKNRYLKFCNCVYQSQYRSRVKPKSLFLSVPEATVLAVQCTIRSHADGFLKTHVEPYSVFFCALPSLRFNLI